jgi:hypothetical protein
MGRELRETGVKQWAIHETVSEEEGPITPAFMNKADLIEHLVAHGTAWDEPWTRPAAEDFVYRTGWAPSFILGPHGVTKGYEVPTTEERDARDQGGDRRRPAAPAA